MDSTTRAALGVTFAAWGLLACEGSGSAGKVPDSGDAGTRPLPGSAGRVPPPPVPVVECGDLAPVPDGVCSVTPGADGAILLRGTVLAPEEILHGGSVLVNDQGTIDCVGCDCAAGAADATLVNCPSGVISPGLIDTHDHLTFTQHAPFAGTEERFEHRHDWRLGLRGHTRAEPVGTASPEQILWGEIRLLLGGATSMIGAGGVAGFLRNLDGRESTEVGGGWAATETFPLGDQDGILLESGCAYPERSKGRAFYGAMQLVAHVAEGAARNEFVCMSRDENGTNLLSGQLTLVHGLALTASDFVTMQEADTKLVWSPRSNTALYGDTARVTTAASLQVRVALGTDWTSSGSMNLLRELACADAWNQHYLDGFFTARELWNMVASDAAAAAGAQLTLGALGRGFKADVAIFDGHAAVDHRAVIEGEPATVTLVLRGGKPLYGDAAVVGALASGCDTLDVCGTEKRLCVIPEAGKSLADLTAAAGDAYPLFFCGVPPDEPTCLPSRPASVNGSTVYDGLATRDDPDGDGVPDRDDDCPRTFNPVRPEDQGEQPDADGDGAGDACDATPLGEPADMPTF